MQSSFTAADKLPLLVIKLDRSRVEEALRCAPSESTAIIALYRMVYPQWEEIETVGDDTMSWPTCNHATWKQDKQPDRQKKTKSK